jgi:hypothetical protein
MVYFRCPNTHYFSAVCCPWDDWSHPDIQKVIDIAHRLTSQGAEVTIGSLKEAGVEQEFINRVMIIEFGDPAAALEGIKPKYIKVPGKSLSQEDLGPQFK